MIDSLHRPEPASIHLRGSLRIAALAICVLLVSADLCSKRAFAWNNLGHEVVAELAWRQLDSDTKQGIIDVLRRHPRFDTDFMSKMEDDAAKGDKSVQDHWIWLNAATWPDQIRKNKEYDRPTWHYIDLPQFLDASDQRAFANRLPVNVSPVYNKNTQLEQMNVLQAISYCRTVIRTAAPAETKAVAYCWLFHLVGDIHQPLHSAALFSVKQFPKGDEGGNKILLKRGKNLHALWDGLLGRQYYMRNAKKAANELDHGQRFRDVFDSAGKETDPRKWADESHKLCKSFVYDPAILDAVRASSGEELEPIELPQAYYKAAGEQARRRIVAAGVRLGILLKSLSIERSGAVQPINRPPSEPPNEE
jgi:hypothetical protein